MDSTLINCQRFNVFFYGVHYFDSVKAFVNPETKTRIDICKFKAVLRIRIARTNTCYSFQNLLTEISTTLGKKVLVGVILRIVF